MVAIFQEMTSLAQTMNAINLAQGIPEPVNDGVIRQSIGLSLDCHWQYTDTAGDWGLRAAICKDYRLSLSEEHTLVTSGCTESLLAALLAAKPRYGEVIAAIEPFYPYYPGFASLIGMRFVTVPLLLENGLWRLDEYALVRVFESGVRILVINTPHNPSGWVLDKKTGALLVELCDAHDALLIVDNVYADFTYDDDDLFDFSSDLIQRRCVIASSVSKMLAASGLRLGWLLGPSDIVLDARLAHMHMSNCQPLAFQRAVGQMLMLNDKSWRSRIRAHYKTKRDRLFEALTCRGFECVLPSAGHYILADYERLGGVLAPAQFARAFAQSDKIVGLPMHDFFRGAPPNALRFSFAAPKDVVDSACRNLLGSPAA